MGERVRVDGKFFRLAERRFVVRGVTYGTFGPRADGALFPESSQIEADLGAISTAGFNTIRTYTVPTEDLLDAACRQSLRVIAGVFYHDWRYLIGNARADRRGVVAEAVDSVKSQVRTLAGRAEVMGVCVGNEVPADALRWVGHRHVSSVIERLAGVVREADPELLVTFGNYPTTEYLGLDGLDFLTFNVFLERQGDLRRYLNRLHNIAGARPLLLGELGLHAAAGLGGDEVQATALEEQVATALERGAAGTCVFSWTDDWHVNGASIEGWRFGVTRRDRSPRPALDTLATWNRRTVADLATEWPSISVIVCAYNSEATLDECLRHACALDYPDLEVIVVDDGSTDRSPEIVLRHQRARLLTVPHGGLSQARNAGISASRGEVIAFLDADAYPGPEWPYYLALGLDRPEVGAVGGPNLSPPDDSETAQVIAHSPGGPAHVLLTDDRAEHIPGCNMAFRREALIDAGGFDPVYTQAGDDVDLCWRLLDRGVGIAFHPAAMVWHHRRTSRRAYLRQQFGYGRAEALVAARHPDRFSPVGAARWRGLLYDGFRPLLTTHPIYRGRFGTAPFQAIYRGPRHTLDLAHQVGVPLALASLPLLLSSLPWARGFGAAAFAFLAFVFGVDMLRVRTRRGVRFRADVALLSLVQPIARLVGRLGQSDPAARPLAQGQPLTGSVSRAGRVLLILTPLPRAEVMVALVRKFRSAGLKVIPPTGWEAYDCRLAVSTLVESDVISSAHVPEVVQVRVRTRLRPWPLAALAALAAGLALSVPLVSVVIALAAFLELGRGLWRSRRAPFAVIEEAVDEQRLHVEPALFRATRAAKQ